MPQQPSCSIPLFCVTHTPANDAPHYREMFEEKCTFNTERDFYTESNRFVIFLHILMISIYEVRGSPVRSSPTRRAFYLHLRMTKPHHSVSSQLQRMVTTCPLCCGRITVQWKLGARPALLKSFSCLKTYEVFTQGQLQTAGGKCREVLFEKPPKETFGGVVWQVGLTELFGISHPV